LVHAVAPGAALYVPGRHQAHTVTPCCPLALPTGHTTHAGFS